MFRLLRLTVLLLVDCSGPRHLRTQRRERAFGFVHRLREWRYRILDRVLPRRRRALSERGRIVAALRSSAAGGIGFAEASTTDFGARASVSHLAADLSDLKVGLFIPSFLKGQGGAEKVAGQLANVIALAGSQVDLFCRAPDDRPPAYAVEESVRIRYLDEQDDTRIEQLRQDRYDVLVFFGMAHFYRRIPYMAQLIDAPFVIQECTNPDHMTRLLHRLTDARSEEEAYWLRQAVFAHAAAVRFTSRRYRTSIVDQAQPFAYSFYNAFRIPETWHGDNRGQPAKKFICVGAFKNENKNGMPALTAFCHFSKRHRDWCLALYGDNNYAGDIARILSSHDDATVHDEGVARDIGAIYGDAHALIIPSFEEGLPNVVVEAFSFGVPCIGYSDCEAVAHLIRHGENGLLVDRTDPGGLERALEEIADSDTRQRLSEGARSFALEHFDFDLWRQNWLRLLHNAANGLNNEGEKQYPAAVAEGDEGASRWSRLLESFRAIA